MHLKYIKEDFEFLKLAYLNEIEEIKSAVKKLNSGRVLSKQTIKSIIEIFK